MTYFLQEAEICSVLALLSVVFIGQEHINNESMTLWNKRKLLFSKPH